MAGAERDSTGDWQLPERRMPPTIVELEGRIEEALVTARAAEGAVMTVGAAALDAAEQARRAAELAERAAGSAAEASRRGAPPETAPPAAAPPAAAPPAAVAPQSDSMRDFSERADRIVARLRQLQRLPLTEPAAPQGGGQLGADVAAGA